MYSLLSVLVVTYCSFTSAHVRPWLKHRYPARYTQLDGWRKFQDLSDDMYVSRDHYLGDLYDTYGRMMPGRGWTRLSKLHKYRHDPTPQQKYELLSTMFPNRGFGVLAKSRELDALYENGGNPDPLEVEQLEWEKKSMTASLLGNNALASIFGWKAFIAEHQHEDHEY